MRSGERKRIRPFLSTHHSPRSTPHQGRVSTMHDGQMTTDNRQTCIRCPTPENLRCAGLVVRRFCELIDPSCPQYDPGYLDVIAREARRGAVETDVRLASYHQTGSANPIVEGDAAIVIPADCCGGGVPPGVFDEP